jgi:predicted enzyme related to lactoylglutathione lyase
MSQPAKSPDDGQFVWYELLTTEPQAADAFYRGVLGWDSAGTDTPGKDYTILSMQGVPVGGLMELPGAALAAGARPGWMGYVAVDDVDAYVRRFVQAGGSEHHAAEDIPGVGRFAVVADPQGAPLVLFRGSSPEGPPRVPIGTPGHVGWHELYALRRDEAFAFYAGMFGWSHVGAVDMGAAGDYLLFATEAGHAVGGIMDKPAIVPGACWLFYFNVDDIQAAVARVHANAGQIINGPHQVPGGPWIVHGVDAQGAIFCLVAPK